MDRLTLPCEFSVTRQAHGTVTVLVVVGELDMATTPLLEEALDDLERDAAVVLDLGDLTFIDSHGLHAIFGCARKQDLILARPQPNIIRLLELTKGERVLRIENTLEDALEAAG
jgi:anti-anti-sigma factor